VGLCKIIARTHKEKYVFESLYERHLSQLILHLEEGF
jgi:hypothetical protein